MKALNSRQLWSWIFCIFLLSFGLFAVVETPRKQPPAPKDPILELAQRSYTGDLQGMVARGNIRVLTTYNPLFISYKDLEQRGAIIDISQAFQSFLRKRLGKPAKSLTVTVHVVPRDELIPRLLDGQGDIIAANMTITEKRKQEVAFGTPNLTNVDEVIVTSPVYEGITSLDEITDPGLHLRKSSSYYQHLLAENSDRLISGRPTVPVTFADERLEDFDILEMMNAGLVSATVVDNHKAALWKQVFPNIRVHEDLKIHTDGATAWAVRKDNPKLLAEVNAFQKKTRQGSFLGNMLRKKYTNARWIQNNTEAKPTKRLRTISEHIKKYSDQYGFDWLLIAAQGYQESGLDQNRRSPAGAIGIMQVLPSTARDASVRIPDIHIPEKNIHAGIKYLKHLHDVYYSSPDITPLNQMLFSLAAYNAGPGNIARARKRATKMGLDPDVWFENVEIAAAASISQEPVTYVRNIFKYYVSYKERESGKAARQDAVSTPEPETASP